jgi:hypothetical protein
MKTIANLVIMLCITLTLISCNESITKSSESPITINQNGIETVLLFRGRTPYAKYLEETDGVLNIDAQGTAGKPADFTVSAGFKDLSIAKKVLIGEVALYKHEEARSFQALQSADKATNAKNKQNLRALFGREISYNFNGTTQNLYVPQVLEFYAPEYEAEKMPPFLTSFPLSWNADDANKNGVVVQVEWVGEIQNPDGSRIFGTEHKRVINIIPDNGTGVLDNEYFKHFPHGALLNVTLVRGNLEVIEVEKQKIKLMGASYVGCRLFAVSKKAAN